MKRGFWWTTEPVCGVFSKWHWRGFGFHLGLGGNSSTDSGGDVIVMLAGPGLGGNISSDIGGSILMTDGDASSASGGAVSIMSGYNNMSSSGNIIVGTSDSGFYGMSGSIVEYTGDSTMGDSGSLILMSGCKKLMVELPWMWARAILATVEIFLDPLAQQRQSLWNGSLPVR
jgi:hypothetical protein